MGLRFLLQDKTFKERHRRSRKHFTRSRKMGFTSVVIFLLNMVKKAVQIELDRYMEIQDKEERISQQAISKARQNISPEAFKEIL